MSPALSIAHVHWALPPTTGGTESHLADLARRQAEAGLRVALLTGEPDPTVPEGCTVESTPLLNLDTLRNQTREEASLHEETKLLFEDFVERHRVDVVHGHNLHHFFPTPALALDEVRRSTGLCIHHTFHETWPDLLAATPVYRSWDGNYAISSHVQLECEQRIGFRPELLRNPVDTEVFVAGQPPLSDPSRAPTVLHPARLLPWKGVHVTVRAIDQLRRAGIDVKLVLTDTQRICDWDDELDEYRLEIHALVSELSLTAQVEFVSVSYSDMPALYRRCDIVVYPTVGQEPLGLVPMEAMSCGRPIVATRSGGISESIVDGVTGYLVERGDVDGLASALAALIGTPASAQAMGAAGASWVRSNCAIGPYIAGLTDRYRASINLRRTSE